MLQAGVAGAGVVDGAENNHPSVVAKKFYEVSKFYTLDEHMRIPDVIGMSMKLWNQLNPDQQKAALEAGARTQAYMRGAWKISELKDLQALKSNFTEIMFCAAMRLLFSTADGTSIDLP